MSYVLSPENTTDKKVTWTSDNPSIVSIDEHGTLTALEKGSVTITLSQKDVKDSFLLTVLPIPAKSIEITSTPEKLAMKDTLPLEAMVLPDNAEDKTITWSLSDPSLAVIENGVLIPLKSGTITITASTSNQLTDSVEIQLYGNTGVAGTAGALGLIGLSSGILYQKKKRKKELL